MNERNKLKKAPYDKRFLTAAENTVKFPRNGRNKNENLHAGQTKTKFIQKERVVSWCYNAQIDVQFKALTKVNIIQVKK